METLCGSEMLTKAAQLWAVLDDMAENNPESYHQFMQQQLEDAKQHYAPPEPCMCLKTHILKPTKTYLFINLCSWNRVPAPKSPLEPVLLSAGKMEALSDKSETCSILDIAYNPSVLEQIMGNQAEKDQLIHGSLKYIEEHYNITLSRPCSVAKFKLKGSLERMRKSLRRGQPPLALSQNSKKEVTLSQLRSLMAEEDNSGLTVSPERPPPSQKRLIEEICTANRPEVYKPAYEITTKKDANEKPLEIELKIELPEVCCVSECNLSVSKDDVLIECLEKYRLQVDLPESVDEEATSATFCKKKGVLLITMPVYKGE